MISKNDAVHKIDAAGRQWDFQRRGITVEEHWDHRRGTCDPLRGPREDLKRAERRSG